MQARHNDPRLPTVAAALLLAAERLLRFAQLACLGAIPARIGDGRTRRKHSKLLQPQVNTDMGADGPINLWRDLLLNHQADVPVPAGFALEGRAFRDPFER